MKSFEPRVVCLLLLLAGLSACDGRSKPHKDELAARVNGTEISVVGVLDNPGRPPELGDLMALESVIDRELLVQQARAKGLDRDPAVQQEIEEARHRILSRVFIERGSGDERLSSEDIAGFYRAHPGLFARRQLFRLSELIVVSDPSLVADIKSRLGNRTPGSRRVGDLAAWLQARKIPYRSVALFKAAEQLPANLLKIVAPLEPGEAVVIERGETTHVVQLVQVLDAPLSLDEAQPAIEEMIDEARRAARSRAAALELRAKARIEYLGAFAVARERLGIGGASRLPVTAPAGQGAAGTRVIGSGDVGTKAASNTAGGSSTVMTNLAGRATGRSL